MFTRALMSSLILGASSVAGASDWQYLGQLDFKGSPFTMFFDTESVLRKDDTVSVWAEGVLQQKLADYITAQRRDTEEGRAFLDGVYGRAKSGYVPAALKDVLAKQPMPKEELRDVIITYVSLEAAANSTQAAIHPAIKIHFEVDCGTHRGRAVTDIAYDGQGQNPQTMEMDHPQFEDVDPDSNLGRLVRVLCPEK